MRLQSKKNDQKAIPSLLSSDIVIQGTIKTNGEIHIEGHVDGEIHSNSVIIGLTGHVKGTLIAEHVTVRGRIEGIIHAKNVHLCDTCHVEGEIHHEVIAVETGAFLNAPIMKQHTQVIPDIEDNQKNA